MKLNDIIECKLLSETARTVQHGVGSIRQCEHPNTAESTVKTRTVQHGVGRIRQCEHGEGEIKVGIEITKQQLRDPDNLQCGAVV